MTDPTRVQAAIIVAHRDLDGKFYAVTPSGRVSLLDFLLGVVAGGGSFQSLGMMPEQINNVSTISITLFVMIPEGGDAARFMEVPKDRDHESYTDQKKEI